MGWRILKYLQHLFYRKNRKGHGIHSPYLFEFINGVIFNGKGISVPAHILKAHAELGKDRHLIPAAGQGSPQGATSKVDASKERSIRSFVRGSSVSRKQGGLLFRITCWLNPEVILELGTGLGVSTLYLASGFKGPVSQEQGARCVHTIEGDPARAQFSQELFKRFGLDGVKVYCGEVDLMVEELSGELSGRFLAFLDANHSYEPTLRYLRFLIDRAGEEAVIVMDDIYWSKGMQRAWREVISWPEIRVSIDLFHLGILLLRKDLYKSALKIKF